MSQNGVTKFIILNIEKDDAVGNEIAFIEVMRFLSHVVHKL